MSTTRGKKKTIKHTPLNNNNNNKSWRQQKHCSGNNYEQRKNKEKKINLKTNANINHNQIIVHILEKNIKTKKNTSYTRVVWNRF